jgi:hypothetical protein
MSTPAIDRDLGVIYVLARFRHDLGNGCEHVSGIEGPGRYSWQCYSQVLFQIGILDQAIRNKVPIEFDVDGQIFNSRTELQRSGLAIIGIPGTLDKAVVVAWAGEDDQPDPDGDPYHGQMHGFIAAYRASNLSLIGKDCTTCEINPTCDTKGTPPKESKCRGAQGAIWQAGRAPAVDGNKLYYFTGNGGYFFDTARATEAWQDCKRNLNKPTGYYGNSVIGLSVSDSTLAIDASVSPKRWCIKVH